MSDAHTIAVLGAGSWGTALALVLARNGVQTLLWGLPAEIPALIEERQNRRFLPGIPFPESLHPVSDLGQALSQSSSILVVVPSIAFASTLEKIAKLASPKLPVAWATKGLDPSDGGLLGELALERLGQRPLAVLSGPTFAKEVAEGMPTAITVAANDQRFAESLASDLHCDTFRAYTSTDMTGVQVGGAAKNVMAIGAGIADGLGFGANARAALITRGLAEIIRLGLAMGAQRETFMGLAGMGDLVLTCTDNQSRNRRMGLALARGMSIEAAKEEIGQAVEGLDTAEVLFRRGREMGVEMPITEQIHDVLYRGVDAREAVTRLLRRAQKPETH
jgi:glycerol-3-phosphate dehydrogenase (NAD(P)+)